MSIAFLCPQGHSLNAPEELAGRPGQCPKCAARFVVPSLEEIASVAMEIPSGGPAEPPPSAEMATPPAGDRSSLRFQFRCPNGHKLHGLPHLRGKPGECPRCHARFVIPIAEIDRPPAAEEDLSANSAPFELAPPACDQDELDVPVTEVVSSWVMPLPDSQRDCAERDFFEWLWRQRDRKSVVELRLRDGHSIEVRNFAPALSGYGFAVFAADESHGKHALTAIRWDAVERLVIRNMEDYPREYFYAD